MNLDDEYSTKATGQAQERSTRPVSARERQARQKQHQTRRVTNQGKAIEATPLDAEQLRETVAELASRLGLKRKR